MQPEVGDQLVGGGEPGEVTHRGDDRYRGDRVDTGHGHQPAHDRIVQRFAGQLLIKELQFLAVEIQLPQQRLN